MSHSEPFMKMHITYGGLMSLEENKFSYSGGRLAKDYRIDPDLMTWSIFQEFTEKQGVANGVEKIWYRLPSENISAARRIYKDKDNEIRKMCSKVAEVGEVYVYIEHGLSPPIMGNASDIEAHLAGGDDGEDADNEKEDEEEEEEVSDGELGPEENNDDEVGNDENRESESEYENGNAGEEHVNERDGQPSEDEAEIVGDGAVLDARLKKLFASAEEEAMKVYDTTHVCGESSSDSENEEENVTGVCEYLDSPVDTDEEWENFKNKDGRRTCRKGKRSVTNYDNPPYLWLMQTFNNGDAFKDQLLRYVLKNQYDVKLNRWDSTKQAAICTEPKCDWRIYCSVEKPIRKWKVKVYEDKHNHVPTGRARMLKQGTIAKLFKEEARRSPDIRSAYIKDELIHMYNVSVSIYKCRKARRIALDMVLENQKQQFSKLWDYEAELL
ncbi:PREDICTED: uncharacterized protein LOC106323085 [Brassica oleracea var. oleracea]|uniref:uncharacterized protein LOC106323085 n=1 Tax=Brassica oleracea var. oleracea TaxID=109376 RepID=UPI0006A6D9D4|nr:PREDICTED: uncharacterized protein LOC106323085 [Brassica oleracea var. oleracea]